MQSGVKNIQPSSKLGKDTPNISVIILSYKNQEKLFDTIQSVLDQDFKDIEIIISDDCSGELDNDRIIKYLNGVIPYKINQNKCNLGTVKHLNYAISLCNGKYIKILTCGDKFFDQHSLSTLYNFIVKCQTIVVASKSIVCNSDFDEYYYEFPSTRRVKRLNGSNNLYNVLAFANIISAVSTLFSREFEGFDETYTYLEDWPCWLRLTRDGHRIPCLDKVTVLYSVGGISSNEGTAFDSALLKKDMLLCYEKEIFPFIHRLNFTNRQYVQYQYTKLKDYKSSIRMQKILFNIRFLPFFLYTNAKKFVKKILLNR